MQTLVLAVQNDSAPSELGVATSSVAFSRSLGGAVGAAVFGAIVTAGTVLVPTRLPGGRPGGPPGPPRPPRRNRHRPPCEPDDGRRPGPRADA